MQVPDYIFTVIDPSHRGSICLSLKYIDFNRIVPDKGGGNHLSVQIRLKLEGSGFELSAIPLRGITGVKKE
jgi:hypothetical protein